MYNKKNLFEQNTNFNVSQFRREFEANNNNNNFRERLVFHSVMTTILC